MNDVSIRTAAITDAETIATISRETFYNAYAAYNTAENMQMYMQQFFSIDKITEDFSDENIIYLLAYDDNNIAGYAKLKDKSVPETRLSSDNVIEVARIYSAVNKISTGIGSKLLNESIAIANKRNRNFIWLDVWQQNVKAVKFYERFGFDKFGTYHFILGDDVQDDWLMAKKL